MDKKFKYEEPCVEVILFHNRVISTSGSGTEWPEETWSESGGTWVPGWSDAIKGQQ